MGDAMLRFAANHTFHERNLSKNDEYLKLHIKDIWHL